ncbi:MAG: vWA domain-containing protein [Catonella sp.]|uniref:vWA domain-containing protein n=1 Tax=Catonella sp. TaxID=2382125 RepID=UPI003FA0172C
MVKAKAAAAAFVDKLLTDGEGKVRTDDKVKVGLVGFGGANEVKTGPALESHPLSDNPSDLKNAVDGYTYYPSSQNSGGTFTQAGLMKAYEILQDNNGHNKAIVLISDGEPTYAYKDENHNKVIGNGYDWYLKTIRETTIAEAEKIKGNNVTIYSLGVGVIDKGKEVLQNIATSADYYSDVDGAADNLNAELDKVADKVRPNIINADIELTMNDMVEFKNAADLTEIKVEIKGPDGADQAALTAKADAIKKL